MSLLPDWRIRRDVKIEPFAEEEKRKGKISYGLSSYGYDVRVGYKFKIFTPTNCAVVDPKNFDSRSFIDVDITPGHVYRKTGYNSNIMGCTKCGYMYGVNCRDDEEDKEIQCHSQPDHILIPPNSFCLSESLEYFEIPDNVTGLVTCKSTYARCGICVPSCVLEAGWKGKLTLEISNCSSLPAKVFVGDNGIAQILFFEASEQCEKTYKTRDGKYQDQKGLTLPFVE